MSLIAHYPLNGDTLDYSGNGNHATNHGAVVDSSGKIGKCYTFGDNRSVRTDVIDLKGDVSFALWIYPLGDSIESSFGGLISNHYHSSPPANFTMRYMNTGRITVHAGFIDGTRSAGIETSATAPIGEWCHVVFTYEVKANIGRIYFDGIQVLEEVFPKTVALMPYNIVIGQWAHTYLDHYEFNGKINDVRVYDHALSEKEVKEIYKTKILHYTFDDFQEPTENLFNVNNFLNNLDYHSVENYDNIYPDKPICRRLTRNSETNSYYNYSTNFPISGGKQYTFSFYARLISAVTEPNRLYLYMSDNVTENTSQVQSETYTLDYNWKRLSVTITTESTATSLDRIAFHTVSNGIKLNTVYEIACPQLEEKDHATSFTPTSRQGIVRDISGHRNDAVLGLSTSPQWIEDSKIGKGAYEFNGVNEYIEIGDVLNMGLSDMSVSAWIKAPPADSNRYIISKSRAATQDCRYGLSIHSSGFPRVFMQGDGGADIGLNGVIKVDDNVWHHVVFIYDRDDKASIYVDGVFNSSVDISHWKNVNMISDNPFRVGSYTAGDNTSASSFFSGLIDDIKIYATALSEEDIKELYMIRASLDNKGNLYCGNIIRNVYKPSEIDYSIWEDGQSGAILPFGITGSSANNSRVMGVDPWGKPAVVWKSTTQGTTDTAGIYNTAFPIDNTKLYRMSWWQKRVSNGTATSCRHYVGCNAYGSVNGIVSLSTGAYSTNPYFWSSSTLPSQSQLPLNQWTLIVGHIFPHTHTGTTRHPDSGRYTLGGYIGATSNDFKWAPETTTGRNRCITIYQSNGTGVEHHTVYPRVDICDGSEPTIRELLNGWENPNLIEHGLKNQGLNVKGKLNTRSISEVGITHGLVAYYPFDKNANDYSGNNLHGTVNGATIASGIKNQCYNFDGVDDYINSNIPVEIFNNNSMFTISLWVKLNDIKTGTGIVPFGVQSPTNSRIYIGKIYTNDTWSMGIGSSSWGGSSNIATTDITHLVMIVDKINTTAKLYVNSDLSQTKTGWVYGDITTSPIIGKLNSNYFTNGLIDEVRIYNRALSEEEIKIMYDIYNPEGPKMKITNNTIYIKGNFKEGL